MTFAKITLASGDDAIYDVQPQYVNSPAFIAKYGDHLWTKFSGVWHEIPSTGPSNICHPTLAETDPGIIEKLDSVPHVHCVNVNACMCGDTTPYSQWIPLYDGDYSRCPNCGTC
jgi:hypothetical protein